MEYTLKKLAKMLWKQTPYHFKQYQDPGGVYRPWWLYYIYATCNIFFGLLSLFTIPFGWEFEPTGALSEWQIRRALEIKKSSK